MSPATFEQIFLKLARHVQKHFGVVIHFVDLGALRDVAGSGISQLESGETISVDGKIYIPLIQAKKFVGATEIERSQLNKISSERLDETIRLLLEPTLDGLSKIESLKDLEDITYNNERENNVVLLNDFRNDGFGLRNMAEVDRTKLNFPFVIESKVADDIHKMALEIHYHSGRYAFLSVEDLDWSQLDTTDAVNTLGAMTIFIPEIGRLDQTKLKRLLAFMKSPRTKDSPQILAGTSVPVPELKSSAILLKELTMSLMVGYLCLNAPFETYKSVDWLDFFFDSLSGPPSPRLDV